MGIRGKDKGLHEKKGPEWALRARGSPSSKKVSWAGGVRKGRGKATSSTQF